MSKKIEQYLREAERAERQAASAKDEQERAAYLHIAVVWRELAETHRRLEKGDS